MDYFAVNADEALLAKLPEALRVIHEALLKCLHHTEALLHLIQEDIDGEMATARAILRNQALLVAEQQRANAGSGPYILKLRAASEWAGPLRTSAHETAMHFSDLVSSSVQSAAIDARLVTSLESLASLSEALVGDAVVAERFLTEVRRRITPVFKPASIGLVMGKFACELDPVKLVKEMECEALKVAGVEK